MTKYIILIVTLLYCSQLWSEIIQGRVIGVADGDTISILDAENTQHKIRLSGIDAPEKKQPYGNVSKQSLSELVFNKQVSIEWTRRDRYQRILGKVLVDNIDANLEQVEKGLAWHYKKYQKEQSREDIVTYDQAEQNAINAKFGLWEDKQPIAPWKWRQTGRSK